MFKLTVKLGIIWLFFAWGIFIAIIAWLPEAVSELRMVITYIPIEYRVGIYLLFWAIVYWFGASFIK